MKETLEMVKELIGFFTNKLQIIQGKMKIMNEGIDNFITSIVDEDNKLKDQQEWSDSFDNVVRFPTIAPIFEG